MPREYFILLRTDRWWVHLDGTRTGPYLSRQVAIDSAIQLAKVDFKEGRVARVSIEDGHDIRVIYDSSPPA